MSLSGVLRFNLTSLFWHSLEYCFSIRDFTSKGDMWLCLDTFLVLRTGGVWLSSMYSISYNMHDSSPRQGIPAQNIIGPKLRILVTRYPPIAVQCFFIACFTWTVSFFIATVDNQLPLIFPEPTAISKFQRTIASEQYYFQKYYHMDSPKLTFLVFLKMSLGCSHMWGGEFLARMYLLFLWQPNWKIVFLLSKVGYQTSFSPSWILCPTFPKKWNPASKPKLRILPLSSPLDIPVLALLVESFGSRSTDLVSFILTSHFPSSFGGPLLPSTGKKFHFNIQMLDPDISKCCTSTREI